MSKMVDLPSALPVAHIAERSCGGRTRLEFLICRPDAEQLIGETRKVCGWSKTVRKQGGGSLVFIVLNDGSCSSNLQVVINEGLENFKELSKCGVSCSFEMVGEIVKSPAEGQKIELHVLADKEGHYCKLLGKCDASRYPLSKKGHTKEFLREIAHLRCRSYFFSAVVRIRNEMAFATHSFFQQRGFKYIHTPLITASDCEGAGEMFQVTTTIPHTGKLKEIPSIKDKGYDLDYKQDFFGKKAYLTVSGQLAVENFAHGLSDVYTFGPTFRAENSHTSRHLAEFWMIEPEMCFANLDDNMENAEAYVKFCMKWTLERCQDDVQWLDKNDSPGLIARLENILEKPFVRLDYTDAIELLKKHVEDGKKTFIEQPEWGMDLGSEHERYICEEVNCRPTIIFNYPKAIKAFYMKVNPDGKTCQAMDVLVPGIGELIGGSVREEVLETLDQQIGEKGLNVKDYWWYRELRQWGGVPHAGFGLGFERLIMLVTGMENIRDVIPYPRYPGNADF
eukprot:GHVH01016378.1.p1 GENE.GHVH01016378.1~~GHVH01016378.1.p1  ORF type:complete len:507 (-),score=77.42 GHVH01016378.1:83-1603(-)